MSKIVLFRNGDIAWEIKKFPNLIDDSGCLGVIELGQQLDFPIKRIFYLRDIKKGAVRGLHAHKELKQLIICLKGAFVLTLHNGDVQESIDMTADDRCVFVDGKVWREMKEFSKDAVMLVLCDREYHLDEVVRDYTEFRKNIKSMINEV